jgi:magnesium transporter
VVALHLGQIGSSKTNLILPRGDNVVIAFGFLKCIVSPTDVLVFRAENKHVRLWVEELGYRMFQLPPGSHFACNVLEEVLRECVESWQRRVGLYRPLLDSVLEEMKRGDVEEGMYRLVPIKDSLRNFELQIKGALSCLVELMAEQEDMDRIINSSADHDTMEGAGSELELLVENYDRELDVILQDVSYLLGRVQTQQELSSISLDVYRNQILHINVHLAVTGVSLAMCTTIAGVYGMNLTNGLEAHPTAFYTVVGGSALAALLVATICLASLSATRLAQRARNSQKEVSTLGNIFNNIGAIDHAVRTISMSKNTRYHKHTSQTPYPNLHHYLHLPAHPCGPSGSTKMTSRPR